MSFLDRVSACTDHDPERSIPFIIDGRPLGLVPRPMAAMLASTRLPLSDTGSALVMDPAVDTVSGRSGVLDQALDVLITHGTVTKRRGEVYPVIGRWGETPAALVDRALASSLGFLAFGIHVNGLVRCDDGVNLWVGHRATDRGVAPGKLDHVVAGGQPHGLSLRENLVKEAREEAGLDEALCRRARPVGAISYTLDVPTGVRRDMLFVFDLEIPADVTPHNADGEVESFSLMPLDVVADLVESTDAFKFNVSVVIIDLLIRRGLIDPETPDYAEILAGMHGPTTLSAPRAA